MKILIGSLHPNNAIQINLDINRAINRLENNDLRILRAKQRLETTFKAQAKWYEHGEPTNQQILSQPE